MRIHFGTSILSQELDRNAAVASMALPRGVQRVQLKQPLRATWATPIARGNRLHEIPVVLHLEEGDTLGAALIALTGYLAALPQSGTLTLATDGQGQEFEGAVLQTFEALDRAGVQSRIQLNFVAGAPGTSGSYLQQPDLQPLILPDNTLLFLPS
jgi:hypothetical protein